MNTSYLTIAIPALLMLLGALALARNLLVYHHRMRRIDEVYACPDWSSLIGEYRATSYHLQVLDLRKWTYRQFFPALPIKHLPNITDDAAPAAKVEPDWRDSEIEGLQNLVIRQGDMLSEIVNLIRGEPPEDTAHSTHDAVELVRGLKLHCDLYADAAQKEIDSLKSRLAAPTAPAEQRKPLTDEQCDKAIADAGLMHLVSVSPTNRSVLHLLCRKAVSAALTAPAEPSRKPLTDEQCDKIIDGHRWDTTEGRRSMVRAAHGITEVDA